MTHEHTDLPAPPRGPEGVVGEGADLVMRLGEHAFADQVDAALAESPALLQVDRVHVDLSTVTRFDISGLLRILEITAARAAAGRWVSFRLPVDPAGRHILRRWRFPQAVASIVRMPFALLVHPDDLRYFGESVVLGHGLREYAAGSRASVLAYLVERQHFGFTAYPVDSAADLTGMLIGEVDHWSGYAITQLLDRLLNGRAAEISRVVVPELVSNVVEHTEPTVAVVASQLSLRGSAPEMPGALAISVWDNGASIIETLKGRLAAGAPVRVADPATVPRERIALRAVGWSTGRQWLDTRWTPDRWTSDQEILVSSLFPGITRKAATTVGSRERTGAPGSSSDSGYGLFALQKTVTETLGGTVEVRSERNVLRVERSAHSDEPLQATVTHDPSILRMPGDVVTVQIPIADG